MQKEHGHYTIRYQGKADKALFKAASERTKENDTSLPQLIRETLREYLKTTLKRE